MPMERQKLRNAAMLGGAGGLRTFTPAAALALRGRLPLNAEQRKLLLSAAVGELLTDKIPFVPARTTPVPYLGRITGGIVCGGVVAGSRGALAGAGSAAVATMLGYQCRRLASKRFSPARVALVEDAIAISVAGVAAWATELRLSAELYPTSALSS